MNIRHIAAFALLCAFALFLPPLAVAGVAESGDSRDSLEVSLLTCSPGEDIYELYGHSAIRVRNKRSGEDLVFNYGMFDFRTPHFAWRFMRGKTDYFLGVEPFGRFVASYSREDRGVVAQVLDLTPDEKLRVLASLAGKASAEGWSYRYNFLYDNCTTRALDEVTDCMERRIEWPSGYTGSKTQRDVIREFAAASPWARFGQDLILGAEIDHPADLRELMFSPIYAQKIVAGAKIVDWDGSEKPLVCATYKLVDSQRLMPHSGNFPISPLAASLIFLAVCVAISLNDIKRGKLSPWADYLLLLLQGGAGCIVFFLFAFSSHPAVGSNWLVLFLNPLYLAYLPVKQFADRKGWGLYYCWSQIALVCALSAGASLGLQSLPPELYAIFAAYVVRYATNIYIMKNQAGTQTCIRQKK